MKQKCSIRAFTLIELLVVISIIALLIAILLPALSSARYSAKMTQCISHQHQLAVGVSTYATDNKGAISRVANPTIFDGTGNNTKGKKWWQWGNTPKVIHWLGSGAYSQNFHSNNSYTGWGVLVRYNYVIDHEAYYCPADEYRLSQRNGDGYFLNTASGVPASSFMFNPMHKAKMEDTASYRWVGNAVQKVQPMPASLYAPSTAVLGLDIIQGTGTEGQSNFGPGSTHRPYWNIVHFDGSAERAPQSKLVEQRHQDGYDPYANDGSGDRWAENDIELQLLMGVDPQDIPGY